MTAPAASIALILALSELAQPALAGDDPACAQYADPMAYNDCLARHGPKAGEPGGRPAAGRPRRGAQDHGAEGAALRQWPRADRAQGRVHMEFRLN